MAEKSNEESVTTLTQHLARSARRGYTWLVIVSAIPLAVALWLYPPKTQVTLAIAVPAGLIVASALLTLWHSTLDLWHRRQHPLPRVLFTRAAPQYAAQLSLLLEPSPLFNYGHAVSIYRHDAQGFEVFIGVGSVLNVQEDGRILVSISKVAAGQESTLRELAANSKSALTETRVKPFVPDMQLWDRLLTGGANDAK